MKRNREFTNFVRSMGAYLGHYKTVTGKSNVAIAKDGGMAAATISRVLREKTRNPSSYTLWRILSVCGDVGKLQASMEVRPRLVRRSA